ncbi:hypothetical protein NC652_011404 [Populus alba x Populus x berolinensis]|nr:hypothetical protein NC652_011404 [Populus alba x Populus x berolinensis]KAJ7001038.1 hypothetical protein NC653_011468 [Populus alba x Populus x berolinensis]TKS11389.1 hypothetical protein D5086_0000073320 [Populus alba]
MLHCGLSIILRFSNVTQLRPSLLMWKPRHCKKCKVFGHKCHTQASKKVKGDALPVASTTADPTLTTLPAPQEPSMQAPQEPQEPVRQPNQGANVGLALTTSREGHVGEKQLAQKELVRCTTSKQGSFPSSSEAQEFSAATPNASSFTSDTLDSEGEFIPISRWIKKKKKVLRIMIECYGTAFSGSVYFPVNSITGRLVLVF